MSLADARSRLASAFDRLPELAAEQEEAAKHPETAAAAAARRRLALDETDPSGVELRPRLGLTDGAAGPMLVSPHALKVPLSKLLGPVRLDPLTLRDDEQELELLSAEANLPDGLGAAVAAYY